MVHTVCWDWLSKIQYLSAGRDKAVDEEDDDEDDDVEDDDDDDADDVFNDVFFWSLLNGFWGLLSTFLKICNFYEKIRIKCKPICFD